MFSSIAKKLGIDNRSLSVSKINPHDAYEIMSSGEAILIDVRESDEWAATGSPEGCKQVALQNPSFVEKILSATEGNKQSSIIVCCKSGMRGDKAGKLLKAADFENVVNVDGGVLRWISDKLPVK